MCYKNTSFTTAHNVIALQLEKITDATEIHWIFSNPEVQKLFAWLATW